MTKPMRFVCPFVLASLFLVAVGERCSRAQADVKSGTVKLQLEVDALPSLNDLNLTAEQLSALKDMASDTAGTLSSTPTLITDDYKSALKGVREALIGGDSDKIDSAEDKMDDLEDKQDADSSPDVKQSDAAKTKAETFLKTLTMKQVADYISQNADDVDDPAELILDAVHQSRGMSEQDFVGLRDDTAQELGTLAAGVNPTKTPLIIGNVTRLLTRVHSLSDEKYKSDQSSIEDEARKLVAGVDPVNWLRHWMEDELADLLSNPQLVQAIGDLNAGGNN
jgi:hypothetical protein